MSIKFVLAFVLTIFLVSPVMALIVEAPSTITVSKEFREIEIKIQNNSDKEKSFKVEAFFPTKTELSDLPNSLTPQEELKVKIKIFNSKDLADSSYSGTLKIVLGLEELNKKITLKFENEEEVQLPEEKKAEVVEQKSETKKVEENSGTVKEESLGTAGFFSLLELQNLSSVELFLDIVLAVVAVVLLIALIARVVKRLRK